MNVLRVEQERDFRELHELFVAYEADLPQELRHGSVPDLPNLRAAYAGRNAAFLAWVNGNAAGCVAVIKLDEARALLIRLFVRPQHRGAGAARALVTSAIAFARSENYGRLLLDTNKEHLRAAYRLYRSLGFEECAPFTTVSYKCPTFMELRLKQGVSRRSDSNR
jgi:GNAT superfamily N-acetyltransferase